jgi:drug/metabolite transporter (DMT)-like permease
LGERLARVPPVALAALGAGFIAFSAVLVRISGVSPSTAAVFRCAYAVPVLALLAHAERRGRAPRESGERWLALGAGALLGVELVIWHQSIVDVGAGLATALANLQVVFVAFVAWAALGEPPAGRVLAALPVVVAGALLISGALEQGAYGLDPAAGAVYGVLAAITWGGFILLFRRTGREGAVAAPLRDVSLAAAAAAALVGASVGDLDLLPGWPAQGWLAALALSSQVLGLLLIGSALPRLPAALGSIVLMLQPVGAIALGILLVAEAPSGWQLAGVACLLGGVLLASTAQERRPQPET